MSEMKSSAQVRGHLVNALRAMLVGPFDPGHGREVLTVPPSRWYMTGYLAPQEGRLANDPTDEEQLDEASEVPPDENAETDTAPRRPSMLPASLGMSVVLPAPRPGQPDTLTIEVSYADYERIDKDAPEDKDAEKAPSPVDKTQHWERRPMVAAPLTFPVSGVSQERAVTGSRGLVLTGHVKEIENAEAMGLDKGTRVASVFLINKRPALEGGLRDRAFVFQVQMSVTASAGLMARPNLRDMFLDDDEGDESLMDARVADLQFRHVREYAIGHGVATKAESDDKGRIKARTCWLPEAIVKRVKTRDEPAVQVAMEVLATLDDGDAIRDALSPLPEAYGAWIEAQRKRSLDDAGRPDLLNMRQETRDVLMADAEHARARIREGIELLASDPELRRAFKLANKAIAMAARQRSPERYANGGDPRWRLFQLAFILLNIASVSNPTHKDRERVELIFFPTGGGKTEAYLGVIAFMLALRRLRGQKRVDKGLGVAVILRYTLRLLTLDQLGRAATMICALEVLRRQMPDSLGEERFAIGLWVGRSATANRLSVVSDEIVQYKNNNSKSARSPFPLTHCPWCNKELEKRSFTVYPSAGDPEEVRVTCMNRRCQFNVKNSNQRGLPVVFVDEQVYAELPAFLVATVDKFALMPWRGEAGKLFGRVKARVGERLMGPMDSYSVTDKKLDDGVRPPELIVQDELHLISGPLGTMVGLYETAIEALCLRHDERGHTIKPKIIASTATVKQASSHVRSLFARPHVSIFPPPGIDDSESYFAQIDTDAPGRLYVGLAAGGKPMKTILLRAYTALIGAAARHHKAKGGKGQAADPYMTLVGYFNSLRELGGMRRLVEDDVRLRCETLSEVKPDDAVGDHLWVANRKIDAIPLELTSRETTANITAYKTRLSLDRTEKKGVDVVLASNMISVGVDIERLGLMVMAGQPKTTAEYIQASSRVGRDKTRPGLVLTCYNLRKPRDRSHYEHFIAYHESFYRYVEAMSLTPFSGPALDRGLAGVLMALARLSNVEMTVPSAAMLIEDTKYRAMANDAAEIIAQRAGQVLDPNSNQGQSSTEDVVTAIRDRALSLLDTWTELVSQAREGSGSRRYSPWERAEGKELLRLALDAFKHNSALSDEERRFVAPTSMRDVEPVVHVWVDRVPSQEKEKPDGH